MTLDSKEDTVSSHDTAQLGTCTMDNARKSVCPGLRDSAKLCKSSEVNRMQEAFRDTAEPKMRLHGDRIWTDGTEWKRCQAVGRAVCTDREEKIDMAHTSDRQKATLCWQELDGRVTR